MTRAIVFAVSASVILAVSGAACASDEEKFRAKLTNNAEEPPVMTDTEGTIPS